MTSRVADLLLLVVLPYAALSVCLVGSIYRYVARPFTYSTLSSQFLESRRQFYGAVPFHYGILVVLAGHLLAFLVPGRLLAWNGVPWRLYALEVTGLAFGVLTLVGLLMLVVRRLWVARARVVTSPMDWVLLACLGLQVLLGVGVALAHPWGSSWFAASATPYLRSLAVLRPDASFVAAMPADVKLHIVLAYVIIGLLPFTRLVHALVAPLPYLWRRPQVARWWRRAPSGI